MASFAGKILHHKLLLAVANLLFTACGVALLLAGFYLFTDPPRILMSRLLCAGSEHMSDLAQPLFYYVALGLAAAGAVALLASMIGWWVVCLNTYCMLSLYFLIVMFLLLLEFSVCLMLTLWPHCLGTSMDESAMVKALQGGYGVPGREQLTAAIDLTQTHFECCAINSNINYDTSMWRLQSYGQKDWTVPLTCCELENRQDVGAYLDPKPRNMSLCQSLQSEDYSMSRHMEGCLGKLDAWYREQYVWFLAATFAVALVEFGVVLSIIWNCMRMPRKLSSSGRSAASRRCALPPVYTVQMRPSDQSAVEENIYQDNEAQNDNNQERLGGRRDDEETIIDSDGIRREVYVQPPDLCRTKHSTTFMPSGSSKYQYRIAKSYLV